ncbi:tyrosine-type recombinase/integrase [Microlunatus parietis]|uniref:Integrase/recombinase XerD n=1 Tax=Microlunatus parietis TaxID=682979 RepID=A0A7Y9I2H3_9ACTN|nr:site-specific integrase [Microlunatus parietis]NYE68845.1 integrase/recombinase XerD [Microlunatus parietis]
MKTAEVTNPLTLTRMHVLTWLARPRKPWTKVTYWRSLRAFDQWLTEFDLGDLQLTKGIPRPKIPDPIARPITDEAVNALLKARLSRRAAAYVRLALFQALRVHEIAKIRGEELDLAAGWQTVAGKGGVVKPIPIHPEIEKLAESMPEYGWWFPSPIRTNDHVSAVTVSQTVGNALRSVGCRATAHQLRDTGATRFQRQVKDIRVTQAYLRHKSLASSMKYTEVDNVTLLNGVRALHWNPIVGDIHPVEGKAS